MGVSLGAGRCRVISLEFQMKCGASGRRTRPSQVIRVSTEMSAQPKETLIQQALSNLYPTSK